MYAKHAKTPKSQWVKAHGKYTAVPEVLKISLQLYVKERRTRKSFIFFSILNLEVGDAAYPWLQLIHEFMQFFFLDKNTIHSSPGHNTKWLDHKDKFSKSK